MEVLTDENGNTRATYGYTAYGKPDEEEFTGVDKPDATNPDKEPYNVYRFNAKRWDPVTGEYDMGFRNYDPEQNRFLTRDMYNGALKDMNLATDPWTMNRYAFAGGNPISMVELDGHIPAYAKENPDEFFESWKEVHGETYSQTVARSNDALDDIKIVDTDQVKDTLKLVINDLGLNKVKLADEALQQIIQDAKNLQSGQSLYNYLGSAVRSTLGLGADGWFKAGLDTWQGVDHYLGVSGYFQGGLFQATKNLRKNLAYGNTLIDSFKGTVNQLQVTKLGRIAGWGGVAVGFGETAYNLSQDNYAGAIASGGETLMSLATTGVGGPAGSAAFALVGGAMWAGATVYQHRRKIGEAWDSVFN
ncbi:RHS repeat-associated protein [Melghirimyces profundicolus]|uniref:RHS repeat-associated protein n=1 Tax=Melghirimyces profundicolus TaxID=1242148 RepID=A0A2T6AUG6_9BACL|nr:RHS repeat-associated protein [Melghirimyces profundicolus]